MRSPKTDFRFLFYTPKKIKKKNKKGPFFYPRKVNNQIQRTFR